MQKSPSQSLMISIRPVTPADLTRLYEVQANEAARQMAGYPKRDWSEFKAHFEKILADPTGIQNAICLDQMIVGSIALFTRDGLREMGYVLDQSQWGRGIGSRAVHLFVEQIKERPIHAVAKRTNIGSIRILEKSGFRLRETGAELVTYVLE